MSDIIVDLNDRSYKIIVENGAINSFSNYLMHNASVKNLVIISHELLMKNYGLKLKNNLENSGYEVIEIILPDGDDSKDLKIYNEIITKMIDSNCDRTSVVIALGGGVVGDISGFVASSFMRGIKYYQVPTTLLAMVDSSIGGKTGLNFSKKKNIVGSIYQPVSVVVDPDLLNTLPFSEKVSGLGEIIKYGAIKDRGFLNNLYEWVKDIENFPYTKAIERCCQIKAEIVTKDENETDLRRILNFGHTIGHALESHLGYKMIKHGEAVSLGMKCSAWISHKKGLLNTEDYNLLIETINRLPLPKISALDPEKIMHYINFDKKNENGILNFILLNGLGKAIVTQDVSSFEILESIKVLHEY
ncbi:MAG: 3-dehydroquinate synthase [Candidatus Neomarinimicrobiota bacterium]|nr:MAG: 3-dehydroquinate synthase [Candidatus Marinimicrobia bacterium TMED108]RCL89904.1 MAG: 3-dehydroquinate synthase [bacterium]|tara:strand:+ start:1627 stop:2703 length:1077 start_codon:yes stop_codon:yes gene_type:complete